uniref:Tol-Pal system protein TolB n=1 Tax=Candidatus Methanogaster sp. ANME-2c ERB4 TaxID=2759911 RepID=A0A7G9YCZ1_9EURY|nr:Tol-Pal system protein TolB [Methanosarcinales archaeon ANME-2c ERB4]
MLSRKTLVIGIILIAVLGISACIETNHEVEAPVAVTSANEPTDANNQVGVTPVADTSADERSPVWSPDSSKIFFKSDGWICVCNPDGSHREELAEIGWNSLVMDPERKRAFYKNITSDESTETYQAYVMDIDGKNLTKIASLTLEDEYVDDGGYIGGTRMLAYDMHSWSPDRTEIFFTRLGETGDTWVWDEEEGKWTRYKAGTEPPIPVVPDYYGPGNDIKLIAKEHLKTAWVWDLLENELRFVGNVSYGIVHGTLRGLVVWSPDGRYVALPCNDLSEAGSTEQIFVIDMETGESRRLTSFVGSSTWPRWSPDGKKIMYVRMPPKYWWCPSLPNDDEGSDIWVVDIDGSSEKQLTDTPKNWEEGFLRPDGKRIVYASWKPGSMGVGETREIDVRMVNEDGGDDRLLTTITTEFIGRMVWSPDGSKIAVVTWESGEDAIDRDIYMIDMPATEDVKNENHT